MEAPPVVVLLLFLVFFVFSPGAQGPVTNQYDDAKLQVARHWQALYALQNSTYGSFDPDKDIWLNATGFRREDAHAWDLLHETKRIARQQVMDLKTMSPTANIKEIQASDSDVTDKSSQILFPIYQNMTSWLHGEFARVHLSQSDRAKINLSEIAPGIEYVTQKFSRNITESSGEISLRLDEDLSSDAFPPNKKRTVRAEMALFTDSSPGNGWVMKIHGVHDPETGFSVLSTSSEKFDGIFALSHLALDERGFSEFKAILNESISRTLQKWESDVESVSRPPWSSYASDGAAVFIVPNCEYIVYLQQHPVSLAPEFEKTDKTVEEIETELRFRRGIPLPSVPSLVVSATIFSPDCGFILETKGPPGYQVTKSSHLSGPKIEVLWSLRKSLIVATALIVGMQLALLKRQVDEASTPSTRSRISYESLAIVAMGDNLMLSSLVVSSMQLLSASLVLMTAAFACFLNFTFTVRFIFEIWTVQVGDPQQREQERQRSNMATAGNTSNAVPRGASGQAPPPQSAPPPTSQRTDTGASPLPIIIPSDQNFDVPAPDPPTNTNTTRPIQSLQAHFTGIFARFYFSMAMLMLLSIWAFSWPRKIRSSYTNLLCFLYLSYWIPQIYRNIIRNCRQALTWEFVLGSSILRLLPVLYCYTWESNTLFIAIDPPAGVFLAAWLFLQVLVLASQQFLRPRLFVKESWCPPAYDYYPILFDEEGDIEADAGLLADAMVQVSGGQVRGPLREKDRKGDDKIFDCSICMHEVTIPLAKRSEAVATWLGKRTYMITPCNHIFHSECLEEWMKTRLVCPYCREGLPPL